MTDQQLYRSDLLLYIDGVHIPCMSAVVRSGRFTIPEASFDLVPHPQLAGMGRDDHVPVVLFEYDGQSPYGPMASSKFRDDFPPFYVADPKFPVWGEWKLAFEGNIIGWEYAVGPDGNKSMRFNCIHDLGVLTTYLLKYAVGYDDAYKVIGQRTRSASRGELRRLAKDWDLYYPMTLFYKNGLPPAVKKKKTEETPKTKTEVLTDILKSNKAKGKNTAVIEGKSVAYLSMSIDGDEVSYDLPDERIILKKGSSAILRREKKTKFKVENYADGQVATRQTGAGRKRTSAADYVNRPFDILSNLFAACDQEHQKQYRSIIVGRYLWPRISRSRLLYRFVPSPIFEQPIDPTERTTKYVGVFECIKAVGHRFKTGGAYYTRLKAFEALIKQMAQMGGASPAWAFYQTLFSQMLYDLLCIPNPPLYDVSDIKKKREVVGEADPMLENNNILLANYTTIPTSFMGVPPRCNIIFPSEKIEFQYQENFHSQPTRVYVGDLYATKAGLIRHKGIPFVVGYPEEAFDHLRAARTPGKAYLNSYSFLIYPEEYFTGPRTFTTGMPQWWHMMQDKVSSKKTASKGVTTTSSDSVDALKRASAADLLKDRNQTHAYRVSQWEKRKNQAITDAREKAHREGREYKEGDEEFTEEMPKKAAVHKAVDRESAKAVNFATGQVAPSGTKKPKKGFPYKLDMDPFFFAYARYIFYIERYGARVANIQVSDNRNHVAGLPCLILDREKPGMHYYGFIEKIQREFRQDGRSMQIQVSYVRDLLEVVESLTELQDYKLHKRLGSKENENPDEFWYTYDKHPGLVAFNEVDTFFSTQKEWEDDATFVEDLATGQPDPVPTVAFVTGIPEHASEFYGRLLWGGTAYSEALLGMGGDDAPMFSMPLEQIFRLVQVDRDGRELEDGVPFDPRDIENQIKYVGENSQSLPLTTENYYLLKFWDHLKGEGFNPVQSYDDAVKYTWRPICNLHQYLRFFVPTWEAVLGAELLDTDFYKNFMEKITDPSKNVAASYPVFLYLHPYMFSKRTGGFTSNDLSHIPPGNPVPLSEEYEKGKKKQTYKVPALDEVPHTRKAWQYILSFYRRTLLDHVPEEW